MKCVIHDGEISFESVNAVGDISGVFSCCKFFKGANECDYATYIHRFIAILVNKSPDRLKFKSAQHYRTIVSHLHNL
jgi:hypothetical protein